MKSCCNNAQKNRKITSIARFNGRHFFPEIKVLKLLLEGALTVNCMLV